MSTINILDEQWLTQNTSPITEGTTRVDIRPKDCASTPLPMQTGLTCISESALPGMGKAVGISVEVSTAGLNEIEAPRG